MTIRWKRSALGRKEGQEEQIEDGVVKVGFEQVYPADVVIPEWVKADLIEVVED